MKNYLDLGNWNAICDCCGRKFKASMLRKRWDGLMVCAQDYETRHPQDFLRVRKERIAVPFSRPYPSQDSYLPTVWACTLDNSVGIAGRAQAGCALAGSVDGVRIYMGALAGKAITGFAITGVQ